MIILVNSKRGLVYDKTSGYFLLHSLPRFPRRTSSNKFIDELPDNAGIYGQHFLCMTTNLENNNKIIKTLNIINPQLVISNGEGDNVGYETDEVLKLVKNKFDKNLPPQLTNSIKTISGKEFIFFSRSRNEESLQYDTLIPEYFKDDFFVETWTKPKMLDSICKGPYEIRNVKKLKFDKWEYISTQEHSIWAVSVTKDV